MSDTLKSFQTEHEGIRYNVEIVRDDDSRPDGDCYTAEDVQAWRDDEWCFCGVIVTVAGDVETQGASLWGVDYGHPRGDDDYAEKTVPLQLMPEALQEYRDAVADAARSCKLTTIPADEMAAYLERVQRFVATHQGGYDALDETANMLSLDGKRLWEECRRFA